MFGIVSKHEYNNLDKKYVAVLKELNDIKNNCVMMRKSDMDVLMSDMKKLEADNRMLLNNLERYQETMGRIFRLADGCNYDVKDYKGLDTTANWIKIKDSELVCSKCGYAFWNGTDRYQSHCCGCGRRMENIIIDEEK